jgi:imidazolonepropionase-like amidohydrolase
VCIKSDSNELMRHLYQEAAKCVKYGGMSEDAALATITLNGAKQLGIDGRTGSIDVGKDADLAVFNGHPLNSYARPEMTLVEGEVYFQRTDRIQPNRIAAAGPAKAVPALKEIPRNAAGSYALTGVTVHPVSRPPIEGATVVIRRGRIAEVFTGAPAEQAADAADRPAGAVAFNGAGKVAAHALPAGTSVIHCDGLHLYPGMIDAASVLGLVEVGAVRETHDFQDSGTYEPDLRASVGLNPDSQLIPVTRANGVTTVVTRPEGGVISGQGTLIDLAGWVAKEMVVRDQVALHIELPRSSPRFRGGRPGGPTPPNPADVRKANEEKVRRLKELFRQAVAYDNGRKHSAATPVNPRLEALVPYARGQRPVVIDAQRRKEILEALKLGDELKLKVVIAGGIEAWKVADELKKRHVPVIVGPVMQLPLEQYDPYDAPYACAARLHEAGVPFCICIHSVEMANERNLPYEAATAVAYGLPAEEGLKAVTSYPAQILGVADEVGSIDSGKRANLVLTNGDVLQATTQVVGLFIDGRPLPPTSKHTRLYERYRERLREVREGRAVLGTK